MKTPSPHAGPKAKRPSESQLKQLGALTFAVSEARAILKKTARKYAPCSTIYSEEQRIGLILEFLQTPSILDATWKPKTKSQREWLLPAQKAKAIQWAKMFSEAPLLMMDALPKINKCLNKFVNRPMRAVVFYFARKHDMQRFYGKDDFCERFWTEKMTVLKDELKIKLQLPSITEKTIEHARAFINKLPS